MLGLELAALREHLQHQRSGGQGEAEADDQCGRWLQSVEPGGTSQQHGAQNDLRRAQPEDDAAHYP